MQPGMKFHCFRCLTTDDIGAFMHTAASGEALGIMFVCDSCAAVVGEFRVDIYFDGPPPSATQPIPDDGSESEPKSPEKGQESEESEPEQKEKEKKQTKSRERPKDGTHPGKGFKKDR